MYREDAEIRTQKINTIILALALDKGSKIVYTLIRG